MNVSWADAFRAAPPAVRVWAITHSCVGVSHVDAESVFARQQSALTQTHRLTSLALVLLLHGLLLMLLLQTFAYKNARILPTRETILRLLPLLKPAPRQEAAPRSSATPRPAPLVIPAAPEIGASPQAPDLRALGALGKSLFGCAPERLATLTPEERARCSTGLVAPDRSVVTIPKSHVRDPQRRAAEMAARNKPLVVPCTYVIDAPAPYGSTLGVMANPICVLDGLVNGFGHPNGLPP